MARLTINCLGAVHVTLDGQPVAFRYQKVLALLIFLAVEADRPHQRESLVGLLWPDQSDESARVNLRKALSSLRQALGDRATATPFLDVTRSTVQFNPQSDYTLDVATLSDLLAATARHPHRRIESCRTCAITLQKAAALYRGPFLADFTLPAADIFDEWATVERERLQRRVVGALAQLAAYHERAGAYHEAQQATQTLLDLEPWKEATHRELMRLFFLSGDRAGALAQYERCVHVLDEELGVPPEAATTTLYEQIRADEETSLRTALAVPSTRPAALPLQPTPFVGRTQELEAIGRLIERTDCRLLTLVGPGGIGKTRLALQLATEQLDLYRDGVHFVTLSGLTESRHVPQAIASLLKLELGADGATEEQVAQLLRGKEMLLVLDNMEQLLDSVGWLADLLAQVPELTLVATSRTPLSLQGEWLYTVTGLPLPATESDPDPDILIESEAVALFVQSAQRARPGFALSEENAAFVAHICHLVGGMPLAIDLAAAWVRVLSCQEIAAEIERDLAFLSSRSKDNPSRHSSLTVVFNQSWRLLSEPERDTLKRLSPFRGGFRRAAAESVAGGSLAVLTELVGSSWLRRAPTGRYIMHEMPRKFVAERLQESAGQDAAQLAHLTYCVELAERIAAEGLPTQIKRGFGELEEEQDNIRAALAWALEHDQAPLAGQLAGALHSYWYHRSHFEEGYDWLVRVLARAAEIPPQQLAALYYSLGVLTLEREKQEEGVRHLEAALTYARQVNDQRRIAFSLNSLGIAAWQVKEYARATALLEESIAIRQELGTLSLITPLNNLGLVVLAGGDPTRAQAIFEEGLAESQRTDDQMGAAVALSNIGIILLDQARYGEAEQCLRDSIELFTTVGDTDGIIGSVEGIAAAWLGHGNATGAAWLCGAVESYRKRLHIPRSPPEERRYLGIVQQAEAQLGSRTFHSAISDGGTVTWEHALERALGQKG